ncbi:MAG: hypothetical protein AB1592_04545 [Pseudomonadota bacterium]
MPPSAGSAELAGLRRRIAALEGGSGPDGPSWGALPFGIADLDGTLGGGLAWGALHAATAAAPGQEGALLAFALALAARAARLRRAPVLLVQQELAGLEGGWLYGPGAQEAGLPEGALILVRVRRAEEALLVMEEALKCSAVCAVLGEVGTGVPDALTATRRLSLAARAGGALGLLLRPAPDPSPCAAVTRWSIAPQPSTPPDAFGGLGVGCVSARLMRNRQGPPGAWRLRLGPGDFALAPPRLMPREDSHDGARRPPLSQPLARPPLDRPGRTAPAA